MVAQLRAMQHLDLQAGIMKNDCDETIDQNVVPK